MFFALFPVKKLFTAKGAKKCRKDRKEGLRKQVEALYAMYFHITPPS
jgi:hypothetical protein